MEIWPLLVIIGEHVVCEELPVRVQLWPVFNTPLVDLIGLPLLLEIVIGLHRMLLTFTPSKSTFWVNISYRIIPAPQTSHFSV
jgi:hypothetical protein